MPLPDAAVPVRMRRVAVVAPKTRLRDVLVSLADDGDIELAGPLAPISGPEVDALRRVQRVGGSMSPVARISRAVPDLAALERTRDVSTLAGEAELVRQGASALRHGPVAAVVGWTGAEAVEPLRARLAPIGAALVELDQPRWVDPPTLLHPLRAARAFRPLIDIYGSARYADLDPTMFAAITFVLMFGIMFGDVGHGLALVVGALALRRIRQPGIARYRYLWPLPAAAGLSAALFGLLYGEAFGPTHIVPTLWMAPLADPVRLLVVAIALGAVLLVLSYGIGTFNRSREDGMLAAVLAPSGVAGLLVLLAGGTALGGWYLHIPLVLDGGAGCMLAAVALLSIGFLRGTGHGPVAIAETVVEVFDALLRTAGNTVSFARLAAFGLVHAALGQAVVDGAGALRGSPLGWIAAIALFILGNIVAFSLEILVAGVQALRLEYYELFSRVFAGEGRPFRPWRVPVIDEPPVSTR